MFIGLVVRTVANGAFLLEIKGSEALAWYQWNLCVYKACCGTLCIVDILHVGVLMQSQLSIRVIIIVKSVIIYVNFE